MKNRKNGLLERYGFRLMNTQTRKHLNTLEKEESKNES